MVLRGWPGDGKHKLRLPTSQAVLELLSFRDCVWLSFCAVAFVFHLSALYHVVHNGCGGLRSCRPCSGVGGEWQTQPVFLPWHSRSRLREVSSAIPTHYKFCDFGGVACCESCLESSRTTSEAPTRSRAGEGSRCARPETRGHRFSIAIFIFVVSTLWIRRANLLATVFIATSL